MPVPVNKVACTICSKEKDTRAGIMPAQERYTAPHIGQARLLAEQYQLPFLILSGRYGLIPGTQHIPYYDYLLESEVAVSALSLVIRQQFEQYRIKAVRFYVEDKPGWAPYRKAMSLAGIISGVPVDYCPFQPALVRPG